MFLRRNAIENRRHDLCSVAAKLNNYAFGLFVDGWNVDHVVMMTLITRAIKQDVFPIFRINMADVEG